MLVQYTRPAPCRLNAVGRAAQIGEQHADVVSFAVERDDRWRADAQREQRLHGGCLCVHELHGVALLGGFARAIDDGDFPFVACFGQLCNRAVAIAAFDLLDEQFLRGFVEMHGRCKLFAPARFHARREMVDEMRKAAIAAAQMKRQEGSVGGPADTERLGHDAVEVGGRDHALAHQIDAFAENRRLQAICDESVDFLAYFQRTLAERAIEVERSVDQCAGCLRIRHHLDERQQMRRIERMPDDETAGRLHLAGLNRSGNARTGRKEQAMRRRGPFDGCPESGLEVGAFRAVLLNEIRVGNGVGKIGLERELLKCGAHVVAERLQSRHGLCH
ncbi:conserved hypothetical protein, partial [Ricinus communis]